MTAATSASTPPALPATPLRFALYFMRRFRWWYALIAALQVGAAACGVFTPYALGQVVGAISSGTADRASIFAVLTWPLLMFALFNLGELVFARLAGMARVYVGPLQRARVTGELFDYLQHHSHRFLTSNFAGGLAARIAETSMGVNMAIWTVVFDFLPIIITLSVSVALLYHASPLLSLFTLTWAVLFVGVSFLFARRNRRYAHSHAAARSETTGRIVDAVTNLSSVRLFAALDFERQYLRGVLGKEIGAARKAFGYNEKIVLFQFTAALALKLGMLIVAVLLWRDGRIGVAEFVMSTSLSLVVIGEARNISRRFLEIFEYTGNVENGVRTIVRPHEIVDAPHAREIPIERGTIEFDHVDFGYNPDRPVFKNLNLRIEAGQRVGLVGFSGSGKSTMLNLLMRLYEPQGGRVLIDGHDVRDFTQASLHAQISLIPQDPGLFHRSLYENIGYGKQGADRDAVEHAARQASAHDFIEQMDDRYESLVGERGVKLSGGQRQRIAIARVIVKNAPILLMDEATSALDSLTERAIQDALEDVMADKTVVVVAHRLSTVAHLDRIVVFDQGRIVEDGSHAELLTQDGPYARLWNQQVNGFLPAHEGAASAVA
jgi:ATP-binding cassette subfamily B protein